MYLLLNNRTLHIYNKLLAFDSVTRIWACTVQLIYVEGSTFVKQEPV